MPKIDSMIQKGKAPALLFLNELPREAAPDKHNIIKASFWFVVYLVFMPVVSILEWLKYGRQIRHKKRGEQS